MNVIVPTYSTKSDHKSETSCAGFESVFIDLTFLLVSQYILWKPASTVILSTTDLTTIWFYFLSFGYLIDLSL